MTHTTMADLPFVFWLDADGSLVVACPVGSFAGVRSLCGCVSSAPVAWNLSVVGSGGPWTGAGVPCVSAAVSPCVCSRGLTSLPQLEQNLADSLSSEPQNLQYITCPFAHDCLTSQF